MIILQRPHQCLMHHVVRYVVVAASRVRAGAARAAPMGARPCVPQTSAVGLTHVEVQWRVRVFSATSVKHDRSGFSNPEHMRTARLCVRAQQ